MGKLHGQRGQTLKVSFARYLLMNREENLACNYDRRYVKQISALILQDETSLSFASFSVDVDF